MQKGNPNRHELLESFLKEWPLSKMKDISLEEYAIGNDNFKSTFTYWVESIMLPLGNIKGLSGGGSFKYGIYFKSKHDKYDTTQFKDDGEYAWQRKFNELRAKAFKEIKDRIVSVIENRIKGNFEAIENIDKLFPLFKWKLAFLYSGNKLFPVYKQEWLYKIATGLGYEGESSRIVDLQKYIMSQYSKSNDFFKWYDSIVAQFIEPQYGYYIVGSNYSGEKEGSILNEIYEKNVIAVGFYGKQSLEKLYLKPVNKIADYLYKKGELQKSVSALTKFLNIKEGDIVAVKYFGYRNNLKIASYAVVKPDDNGIIYKYDRELGHTLNVEYVEKEAELELNLNKSQTVHQITSPEEINLIFGAYQNLFPAIEDESEKGNETGTKDRNRKGTKTKHTTGHVRKVKGYSTTINEFHNQLQTQFYEALKLEKDDPDSLECIMEEGFVDVKYESRISLELYEVKTSPTARKCVKEALGQIVYYASRINNRIEPKIFVVGPSKITDADKLFIDYIKKNSKLKFEYLPFAFQYTL